MTFEQYLQAHAMAGISEFRLTAKTYNYGDNVSFTITPMTDVPTPTFLVSDNSLSAPPAQSVGAQGFDTKQVG